MGRLFTYEEISNDRVPKIEYFKGARKIYTEMTTDLIDEEIVDGSFVFGSVAVDTMGPRSDFETVTALKYESPMHRLAVRAISETIHTVFKGTIPFENTIKPKINFERGHHDFDRFIGQHLTSDDRKVFGNDPAAYMKFARDSFSAQELLIDYLANKERRMCITIEQIDYLDISRGGLQRMLELPCAVGRRTLQTVAEVENPSARQIRSVDKKQVISETRKLLEQYDLVDGFDMLVAADRDYSNILAEAMKGNVEKAEYNDFIRELHSMLPYAIGWINIFHDKLPIIKE